jgi:hypothetical protein
MPERTPLRADAGTPVARYPVSPDESVCEAVLSAFELVDDRPHESSDTVLYDHVDPDALSRLLDDATETRVETRLWGYPVAVTPSLVTVYERA